MGRSRTPIVRILVAGFVAGTLATSSGCYQPIVALALLIWGNTVPAEYEGLEQQRVAVVCVSSSSPYGVDSAPEMLARRIELLLAKEVKGIEIVDHAKIRDWTDNNDWDQLDYTEIGRAVKADKVLVIELSGYSLHEGQTLYKGRADVVVSVYDITEKGRLVFSRDIPDYQFPQGGGRPVTGTSKRKFENLFLTILSQKIANYFYDYELRTEFAGDARGLDT